ncbi:hypothetical protein WISP_78461 [Willisornis vidua]|uniref:RNA-directed DNA polymerase from mobile element jockey n=1 Tax=Willisornis vidua TaxID=1566151 RepID=A0ABQ9DBA6_9PASS|nr:hypothetical protein WISP_78461 [Willisornis vidua]
MCEEHWFHLGQICTGNCLCSQQHASLEDAVSDLLKHLDPQKSMGPDRVHSRMMRELVKELAKPLSIIYQQSWLSGEVPNDWKVANVTPIHKKGCKEDLGNYRPVSLTLVPGKVMEQIILSAITQDLGSDPASTDLERAEAVREESRREEWDVSTQVRRKSCSLEVKRGLVRKECRRREAQNPLLLGRNHLPKSMDVVDLPLLDAI